VIIGLWDFYKSSARSPDRARIETRFATFNCGITDVAPGHQTGRGLKLQLEYMNKKVNVRSARSPDRARIETSHNLGKIWIEVAPGHQTGRGLKLGI